MADSIRCPQCGQVSHNPNDVAQRYCGSCHQFHDTMAVSETKQGRRARTRPCASCPYRKNVPSGIWDAEEYDKLENYDGDIGEQVEKGGLKAFGCHQSDGSICSGWLGHRDPTEMLAVRLAISGGSMDPSCADYSTTVPLFASGAEAAEHGRAQIKAPPPEAVEAMRKITKKLSTNKQEG